MTKRGFLRKNHDKCLLRYLMDISFLQRLSPTAVFILKFLFMIIGLFLFVTGVFDVLHGNFKKGIFELIAGAVAIRLAAFLFSLKLKG